ncbi:MAG: hypothetical protein ACRDNR_13855 [Gaiellaceae bacterium]
MNVVIGVTVAWVLVFLTDLEWAWAIAIVLAVLLLIALEGGYRLWDAADKTATRYLPTWELLQDRADILRALYDANAQGRIWAEFLGIYMAGHRPAAQRDFDMAVTVGFPLVLERDALSRPSGPDDFLAIVSAFEAAASEWREAEQEAVPQRGQRRLALGRVLGRDGRAL